jgi:hypothetical protein
MLGRAVSFSRYALPASQRRIGPRFLVVEIEVAMVSS